MTAQQPRTQSAALPYRVTKDGLQILLITSKTRRRWIIPKGSVSPGKSARESAGKEAFEEAGVEGTVSDAAFASYSYSRLGLLYDVDVYAMEVTKEHLHWPEQLDRRRHWATIDHAATMIDFEQLKEIVVEFAQKYRDAPRSRTLFD